MPLPADFPYRKASSEPEHRESLIQIGNDMWSEIFAWKGHHQSGGHNSRPS